MLAEALGLGIFDATGRIGRIIRFFGTSRPRVGG